MNYLYLRAALDPAKAGHTLKRGRHTPWRGKQANLAYKISLGYFYIKIWYYILLVLPYGAARACHDLA
jgi:hypothetical protein